MGNEEVKCQQNQKNSKSLWEWNLPGKEKAKRQRQE